MAHDGAGVLHQGLARKRLGVFVLFGLMGVGLLSPMASNTVLPGCPDFAINTAFVVQARMAMEEGQFPIRVAPFSHEKMRYPLFQFYSQTPFVIAGLIYKFVTPENPYLALKIVLWMSLTVGAIYAFRLARYMTGSGPAALLAGAAYMTAPYLLMCIFAKGAFAEVVAEGLIPMVLYTSARLYAAPGLKRFLKACVPWALLAGTHMISLLLTLFFMTMLFILMGIRGRKKVLRLLRVIGAAGAGIAMMLYFVAPVAMLNGGLYIRSMLFNPADFAWLTVLPTLLSPVSMPPEPQPARFTYPNANPAVGWPILIGVGLMVFYVFILRSHRAVPRARFFAMPLLAVFAVALFITWSPVDFWSRLPKDFHLWQFPFRFLVPVMWSGAMLLGLAVSLAFKGRAGAVHVAAGLLLVVLAGASHMPRLDSATLSLDQIKQAPQHPQFPQRDYVFDPNRADIPFDLCGELPLVGPDDWLQMFREFPVPPPPSATVSLVLKGEVPPAVINQTIKLGVFVNGEAATQVSIEPGPYASRFDIPVPSACRLDGQPFRIGFGTDKAVTVQDNNPWKKDHDVTHQAFRCQSVAFDTGMVLASEVRPKVRQKGTETRVALSVPAPQTVVQLPVLYYPQVLDLTVDGQAVEYFPTRHRDYSVIGLTLPQGDHLVRVRFRGLAWANWISAIAWTGVIASSMWLGVRKLWRGLSRRRPVRKPNPGKPNRAVRTAKPQTGKPGRSAPMPGASAKLPTDGPPSRAD